VSIRLAVAGRLAGLLGTPPPPAPATGRAGMGTVRRPARWRHEPGGRRAAAPL